MYQFGFLLLSNNEIVMTQPKNPGGNYFLPPNFFSVTRESIARLHTRFPNVDHNTLVIDKRI